MGQPDWAGDVAIAPKGEGGQLIPPQGIGLAPGQGLT